MDARDEEEFAAFVRELQPALFRTAYLLQGDYQRAEDAVQSALVKIYLHWPRVHAMEHPAAYARRVLVNESTSWWRRRSSHEHVLELGDEVSVPGPDDAAVSHEVTWAAIRRLPARQRAVVVLRYYEDLSEAETARVLGMAVGTVKSHCHAACARLAEILGAPTELSSGGQS
jgi:RNA polymerase sigma-70 factor (sigma-E family)